jgi:hypothetical protein
MVGLVTNTLAGIPLATLADRLHRLRIASMKRQAGHLWPLGQNLCQQRHSLCPSQTSRSRLSFSLRRATPGRCSKDGRMQHPPSARGSVTPKDLHPDSPPIAAPPRVGGPPGKVPRLRRRGRHPWRDRGILSFTNGFAIR